jgi:hypothetical protein
MTYRVVYGETAPSWEELFNNKRAADAFAKRCVRRGDRVFSVKKTVDGEGPQSLVAALEEVGLAAGVVGAKS